MDRLIHKQELPVDFQPLASPWRPLGVPLASSWHPLGIVSDDAGAASFIRLAD
ncbi:MAG: hypothetical protein JKY00_15010 [Roseicyclus sp.]|nr:hypothetical protein [Roseicyclus sp.]